MSASGTIFDIKELAVFDGPGLRVTVFFKGCPLRCRWCHNPEGLSFEPQLMASGNGCTHCGACRGVCPTPGACTGCGACVTQCPRGLRRIAGTRFTAKGLAATLLKDAGYLAATGGGYTLSGGEPTAQPAFLLELLQRLSGSHRAIETSGFCPGQVFEAVMASTELIMMDLKLIDPALHKQYTGVDNAPILANLQRLRAGQTPFIIRIPLIPGVNDTPENLCATAALLENSPALQRVELLPYHQTAGAKYPMLGMEYAPGFNTAAAPNQSLSPFAGRGIPARVL